MSVLFGPFIQPTFHLFEELTENEMLGVAFDVGCMLHGIAFVRVSQMSEVSLTHRQGR